MLIAQISDSHITFDGVHRDDRIRDLQACVADINSLDPLPDLVVHSGDVAHDGRREEYDVARQILNELQPPYVVMAGNRDNRAELGKAFADRIGRQPEMPFIQYAIDTGDPVLIMLDTLSEQSNKGDFCEVRLDHLEQLLADNQDRPVVVFMHHPPCDVIEIPDPFQFESREAVSRLTEILGRHSQLAAIFCGHVHRLTSGTVADVPVSTVTSIALDLRKGSYPPEASNRTIYQLHKYGPDGVVETMTRTEHERWRAGDAAGEARSAVHS